MDGIKQLLQWLFSKRIFPRFFAVLALLILGFILAGNISYSKKDGFRWGPSVKVEVIKK